MAGIFGYYVKNISLESEAACKILHRHSVAGFNHSSEYKIFNNGAVCFGYAARADSPDAAIFSSHDGKYTLVLCGELFLPSGEQLTPTNFQEGFIPLFEKNGTHLFLQCDGAFVLALYDDSEQSVYLITDPFGNLSLHYTHTPKGFIFSLQQKALAEILRVGIDDNAIAQFIALGHQLNGRTLYKNIFRIPPASFVKIDKSGAVDFSKYFTPNFEEGLQTEELLLKIEESLLRSVDIRSSRSGVIVGLSGGLDSRITLAALKKLGKANAVTAFTHGLPSSGDIKVATKITSKYHIPHLRIIFDEAFFAGFPSQWRDAINLSEGGLGVEGAMSIGSWKAESENFDVCLDSHAGALYRRQFHKAREGILRRSDDFIKTFFDQFATPLLHSELISEELRREASRIAVQHLNDFFSAQPHDLSIGNRIDLYYLDALCANKYSLSGNAQINFMGLSHPLLSLEAYKAAMHIPAQERRKNIVYRYLFNRFAPELKNFLADDSGYPVPYIGYRAFRYVAPLFEKGLRQLPQPFQRLSLFMPVITRRLIVEKNMSEIKEILLDRNSRAHDILIQQKIEKTILDFEASKQDNSSVLLQALNLTLLLEYADSHP